MGPGPLFSISSTARPVSGNVELDFAFDEDEEDDDSEEEGSTVDNIDEIHNMTVAQIKEELVKFGLKGRGRKADMVAQLQNAVMRKKSGLDMHDTEVRFLYCRARTNNALRETQ
eukprot:6207311-Pleurochrysis_carterae.AAC.2